MSDTLLCRQNERERTLTDTDILQETAMHARLVQNLDILLATARPRLASIARNYGVASDGIDDVIQETCVEAWQHLESLRTPERFDAWLNAICRHVSFHWLRIQRATEQRQSSITSLLSSEEMDDVLLEFADTQVPDLSEELEQQDLAILLDRAMRYLPDTTRKALELHYLAELPQREVALRLGMTINALEVKLHRARRQLREILNGPLRSDAESFGLALEQESAQGWRESRIWCPCCGRRRLQGMFVPIAGSIETSLRMRCPGCSASNGTDLINTFNLLSFKEKCSFRPALKQVLQKTPAFYKQILAAEYHPCPLCNSVAQLRGIKQYLAPGPFQQRFCLILECLACGAMMPSAIMSLIMSYAQVAQFMLQHERCAVEPEIPIEYEGQAALRVGLIDLLSSARRTLIVRASTLEILAVFDK